jgi:hypothetical protein
MLASRIEVTVSKFTVYLLALVKLAALVCVGILCINILIGLLYLTTPRLPVAYALLIVGLDDLAELVLEGLNDPEEEHRDVLSYHEAIRSWVLDCMGFDGLEPLPERITRIVKLPFEHRFEVLGGHPRPLLEGERMPTPGEQALLLLSSALAVQGVALRSKVQSTYF